MLNRKNEHYQSFYIHIFIAETLYARMISKFTANAKHHSILSFFWVANFSY